MNGLITAAITICAAIIILAVWRWSPMGRAQARRAIARQFTAPLHFAELTKPLPPRLREVGAAIEAAGGVLVTAREVRVGEQSNPIAGALYLADDGTILVEAVCGFRSIDPDPATSCMSQLSGRRGLLITESLRNAPELDTELLQVVPGAAPATLLAEHRRALVALRDRGLDVDPITPDAAEEAFDAWVALTHAAWATNGSVYAEHFITNQRGGVHPQQGSIIDRTDLDAKLASLR